MYLLILDHKNIYIYVGSLIIFTKMKQKLSEIYTYSSWAIRCRVLWEHTHSERFLVKYTCFSGSGISLNCKWSVSLTHRKIMWALSQKSLWPSCLVYFSFLLKYAMCQKSASVLGVQLAEFLQIECTRLYLNVLDFRKETDLSSLPHVPCQLPPTVKHNHSLDS